MRSILLSVLGLVALSGCAHTMETHESSSMMMSGPPAQPQGEVIAVDQQAAPEEPARARPRLTQTVTLGQSNGEATYSATPPAPGQQGQGGGTNVTVNNNVTVNQPPAVYGGWGGYGGYGTYGYGRGVVGSRDSGFGRGGSSQWGSSGWEGARRTAAPGQTPGVGGNWSAAPSHGPSQMK